MVTKKSWFLSDVQRSALIRTNKAIDKKKKRFKDVLSNYPFINRN